jgi:glycosyltransferase involved in cell wall biosynthesis
MMAAITVIMPVYNTPEAYLRQAIESIFNQSFGDWHLFIYDDCSTGMTKEILEEYAAKDNKVTLYRYEKNRIASGDFNQAPLLISGISENIHEEYTCELDSDDWYEPDFFQTAYRLAKAHDADIVIGDFEGFDEQSLQAIIASNRDKAMSRRRIHRQGSHRRVLGFGVRYPSCPVE